MGRCAQVEKGILGDMLYWLYFKGAIAPTVVPGMLHVVSYAAMPVLRMLQGWGVLGDALYSPVLKVDSLPRIGGYLLSEYNYCSKSALKDCSYRGPG